MRSACLSIAAVLIAIACNNKEPQVAAVVATAATLQAIQLAREQSPANQPTGECCQICGSCEFPCGDHCVPFGTLCAAPAGCACTTLPPDRTPDAEPAENTPPGTSCPARTPWVAPVPVVD
jgi:hypothetical protein